MARHRLRRHEPLRQPSDADADPTDPSGEPGRPVVESGGRRLGELLVARGAVDPDALRAALLQQVDGGERIGSLLVRAGALDESSLTGALAEQLGVPLVDLLDIAPEPDALATLGESVARGHRAVPVRVIDGVVEIAVADPSPEAHAALQDAVGRPVRFVLATPTAITQTLDLAYRVLGSVDRFVRAFEHDDRRLPGEADGAAALRDDAPVVQVVNLLLTQALRDRASDIHLEPMQDRLRVRFRIDGALHDTLTLPASMGPALSSRLKIMAQLNIVERRRPQDGQLSVTIDDRVVDMRLSVLATIWGEKCVIRLLDTDRSALHLHELGMPADTHAAFSKLIHSPFGMVLCAGPTGSGKTTTLYAALREINHPDRNITTIEDPVEYVFDGINQIHVSEKAGVTFATGLRSILRQDPDVILVGEIRDVETARIAVQSSLTGHFVLSTLHGTDAVAALHRLLDMGIESFLVASSVVAVVGQRLVRRICLTCAEPYIPSDEELAFYVEGGGAEKAAFVRGSGCHRCAGTGYQGRVGVYELLHITPEIKRLLVGWATQEELRRLAVAQGMQTLRDAATRLVEQDVTTIAEVVRSIYGT